VTAHHATVAEMQATHARLRASIGAVPHPHARLYAVHGISFAPGQQVFDSVSGQIGVIRGAGQILHQRQRTRP
jgi:hypothetical protein